MTTTDGIWFVYRSLGEGPLSKRIRRLNAPSIVKWFEWQVDDARTSTAPLLVAQSDLGGKVEGLGALFAAVQTLTLHTPRSTVALRKMLREHLPVGSGEEHLILDDHSLRVLVESPEKTVSLCFFDDEALRANPEQFAYLLQETFELTQGDSESSFTVPFDVADLRPAGQSEEINTYFCIFRDLTSAQALCLPGVAMNELASHFRSAIPRNNVEDQAWPLELRALRGMIEEGDTTLGPALKRLGRLSIEELRKHDDSHLGEGSYADAQSQMLSAAREQTAGDDNEKSVVSEGPHHAVLCTKTYAQAGYEQFIVFDSRWGAANAQLAVSMLKAAKNWDPCAKFKPTRASKATAKTAKTPKAPKAPKVAGAKAVRAPRPKASEVDAAAKQLATWKAGIGERTESEAYLTTKHFREGDLLQHPKFGLGFVCRSELNKCEVVFEESTRMLLQA